MGLKNTWNATSNCTEGTDWSRVAVTLPINQNIAVQAILRSVFSGTAGLVQRNSYYRPIVQPSCQQGVCRNGDLDALPSDVHEVL